MPDEKTSNTHTPAELLSIAVHQLRAPLTRNKWIIDTLLHDEEAPPSDSVKELLTSINEDNERAIVMVNDILKASREEAVTIEDPVIVNIVDIIEKAKHNAEYIASVRTISFTVDKKTDSPLLVLADPRKLMYVFENLFLNSIKYTPVGGSVSIRIDADDTKVHVAVSDNGMGIPDADKEFIFEKFYRASNARLMDTEGTGLGLFIVKQIVEKNKGDISFESTENKGTTFLVSFPLASRV